MVDERKQNLLISHSEVQRTRSNHRKPPRVRWQATVPSWEKKFCSTVGLVPWGKLLETKRCMHMYNNVVQWNDSAGEEAFCNAKKRFWAKIKGLPCDISPPDPNIHIDEIDWNSNVDENLLLELEREPEAPPGGDGGQGVLILTSALSMNQPVPCTGWGEAEDDAREGADGNFPANALSMNQPVPCTGWGEAEDDVREGADGNFPANALSMNQPVPCTGWGEAECGTREGAGENFPANALLMNQPIPCTGWGEAEGATEEGAGGNFPANALLMNQPIRCTGWGEAEGDTREGAGGNFPANGILMDRPIPCTGWGDAEGYAREGAGGNFPANALLMNQPIQCTGWGEAEDDTREGADGNLHANARLMNRPIPCTGWGEAEDDIREGVDGNFYANVGVDYKGKDGWGDCWNESLGLNQRGRRTHGEDRGVNGRRVDDVSWRGSRDKTSRFYRDNGWVDHGCRNGRWRRQTNFDSRWQQCM